MIGTIDDEGLAELVGALYLLHFAPSLVTLRLRKKDEPLLPWYERPSVCFITGQADERCECCGCWTGGRVPEGPVFQVEGYRPGTPLCPGCDDMRRHAGLPVTFHNQRWMHEAYDALPRAVRDYPLEAAHA